MNYTLRPVTPLIEECSYNGLISVEKQLITNDINVIVHRCLCAPWTQSEDMISHPHSMSFVWIRLAL